MKKITKGDTVKYDATTLDSVCVIVSIVGMLIGLISLTSSWTAFPLFYLSGILFMWTLRWSVEEIEEE